MENSVGWQPNPDHRGTLQIIWSCLLTILACTWNIQHLNLPARNDIRITHWFRKLVWMISNVAIPEFLLVQAISEERWARRTLRRFSREEQENIWRRVSRRIVRVLQTVVSVLRNIFFSRSQPIVAKQESNKWTLKHCFYGNMGGFIVERDSMKVVLAPEGFLMAMEKMPEPPLKRDEIDDKSKTDSFAMALAVFQITWLIVSLFTRLAQRIACSQLEILTGSFALCAAITYIYRWHKPRDILVGTTIQVAGLPLNEQNAPKTFREQIFHLRPATIKYDNESARIADDAIGDTQNAIEMFRELLIFMFLIGGVHLVAWEFQFPSLAEKMLWRVACAVATGIPVSLFIAIFMLGDVMDVCLVAFKDGQKETCMTFMKDCLETMSAIRANSRTRVLETQYENLKYVIRNSTSSEDYRKVFGSTLLPEGVDNALNTDGDFAWKECLDSLINKKHDDGSAWQPGENFQEDLLNLRGILLNENLEVRTDSFPNARQKRMRKRREQWIHYTSIPASLIYILARFCVLAVAFSSLRAMPDSVYETTWAKYFPYLD